MKLIRPWKRLVLPAAAVAAFAFGAVDAGPGTRAWDTPASLPGRIEAEDYRPGGQGVGYADTTSGNSGGEYRTDDVDIRATGSGGHYVGWIDAGEWLAYDVHVEQEDLYRITLRVASAFPEAKTARLQLDDAPLQGATFTLAGGDGWLDFRDVTADVVLPAGDHVLKLVFDTAKLNINYLKVEPAATPLVLGMYNNTAVVPATEGNSSKNFRQVVDEFFVASHIKIRRSFNSPNRLPTSYENSAAAQDPAYGLASFLSVKPPGNDHAGVAEGDYDGQIASLAASMPAGAYLTMFHEPENDMTGTEFVAMFRQFYSVAKAANPNVSIGYVAMGYQWREGSPTTANPDDWWPGANYTDWLGCDTYMGGYRQGGPMSLDEDPRFQRWYQWALGKRKPILIPEYGIETGAEGYPDAVRADALRRSLDWVATQSRIRMLLYWNGKDSNADGQFQLNPTTSDPEDRFPLSRAVWNEKVLEYGSTGTNID